MTPSPAPPPPPSNGTSHADDSMDCPNCAERIKKKALVCRFCSFKIGDVTERKPIQDPGETEAG